MLSIGYNPPPSCMALIITMPESGVIINAIQRGGCPMVYTYSIQHLLLCHDDELTGKTAA